jgi:ubiquitin carboxyl-terminal hydrolase 4/11/15
LKDASYYDDPVFDLKDAEYLDPTKYETMEDCNIEPD